MPISKSAFDYYSLPPTLDLGGYDADDTVAISSAIIGSSNVLFIENQPSGITVQLIGDGWPTMLYIINAGAETITAQSGDGGQTATIASLVVRNFLVITSSGFLIPVT